jgi:iron uptake system EfeUOB component EfeO/EfeM
MSIQTLEKLKTQTVELSPYEKQMLADFLYADLQKVNVLDLGLAEISKEEKRRQRENWLKNNREKYAGFYVALDGDKLLGTGKTFPEAAKFAKLAKVKDAFIDLIRPLDYVAELGGW